MHQSQPIKIVLLGCGAVSKLYYGPALQELEKNKLLQVKALFDPDYKNITELQKKFPFATRINNITEITTKDIDIAIIASPPQFHAQQTIQLLQSGLSVLCEKPMASTVAEAVSMVEAASSAPGLLAIGLFRRFFPATQTIQEILSLNVLGDIKSFSFSEGGYFQWPVQSPSYFKKPSAHGVLMDVGVHLLDLMIWWFGNPTEVIYEDDAMGGIEVNCRLQCKFPDGHTGEVRLSRDCMLRNSYLIQGTKGWLNWNVNDAPNKIQLGFENSSFVIDAQLHDADPLRPFAAGEQAYNFEQSFTSQIYNLIAAIKGKETLMILAEEAIKSLKLIESCYQNRMLIPMPWLSESELKNAFQLNAQS
jgi:predicted dehydrogenase